MMSNPDYPPDELLPLSGIQHFMFCRRQWALIHIERQWQENVLTVEGKLMHARANDPFFTEQRSGAVIARAVPVASYRLGLAGVCDVVEFLPSPDGIHLPGRRGTYLPSPVEYKHGREKKDEVDEVQVCAQAMCLEEMLSTHILQGALYYHQTRRRVTVDLTESLRGLVQKLTGEMHAYFARGYTPRVKPSKACRSCSLKDTCLPDLQAKSTPVSVYIQNHIEGEG